MEALGAFLPGIALPAVALPSSADDGKAKTRKIRCQDRAARWRADLERHYAHLMVEARSPDERAALDEAYKEDVARGPDFSRVRREATTFGTPKIKGMDRNMLSRLVYQFEQIERGLWKVDRRDARAHDRKIKRTMPASVLPVLRALARLTVKYSGRVFPSLEGLAVLAQVSRSTCIQAVKLLEQWGLLKITRRCKRVQTPVGVRLVQDTSVYELKMPEGLSAMAAKIFGVGGPVKTGTSSGSEIKPASSTQSFSSEEGVRVADRTQSETRRLEALPDTFDTPRRRIHWSELIRPR